MKNSRLNIKRDFSKVNVLRTSHKRSLKRRHVKLRHTDRHLRLSKLKRRHLKTSRSNIQRHLSFNSGLFTNVSVRHLSLPRNTNTSTIPTIINSKKKEKKISVPLEKQNNQSNLSDPIQDFRPTNSITNSTTYSDMFTTHRSLRRNHRINPINSQNLFKDDFTIENDNKNRKKKKKYNLSPCKIGLCLLLIFVAIGGIIGALIYALTRPKDSTTTVTSSVSSALTTTQNSICTTGGITCPSPMFHWDRSNNCTRSSSSYTYYTCCYRATSTQLTILFALREDVNQWYIDDISVKQGNGELLINGNFESNLTGWTVISQLNPSITTFADSTAGLAHTGSAHLYSAASMATDSISQNVTVIQGQNVNISFWWKDEGGVGISSSVCEGTVSLIP